MDGSSRCGVRKKVKPAGEQMTGMIHSVTVVFFFFTAPNVKYISFPGESMVTYFFEKSLLVFNGKTRRQ